MAIVTDELTPQTASVWSLRRWLRWKPTSMYALAEAERGILAHVWHLIDSKFVTINNGTKCIRTISLNASSNNVPLVLVHGMGSGIGLWGMNLEPLCENRPVHAFDVLGFGRSTRTKFSRDAMLTEMELVEAMEDWRKEMKLKKFVLLGHSMGGFLAAAYAIRYPQNLHHLMLVDPWGFPEQPPDDQRTPVPAWIRCVATLMSPFNPLAGLRVAGPWGPKLVGRIRPDLIQKFSDIHDDDTVIKYIYHCNAQDPSGETAFKNMTVHFGWAKFPMIRRIKDIPPNVPITMMYGSRSWIDSGTGYEVKYLRKNSYVDVQIVRGAGHHVYADRANDFNQIVNQVCKQVDTWCQKLENQSERSSSMPRSPSFRTQPPINTMDFEEGTEMDEGGASNADPIEEEAAGTKGIPAVEDEEVSVSRMDTEVSKESQEVTTS